VSLVDYRVERTEGTPADVKAGLPTFIKLVPTKADLSRTYELRPLAGAAPAELDAWADAFTAQIAAAVAAAGSTAAASTTSAPLVIAAAADV
jgi:hypothetical protein